MENFLKKLHFKFDINVDKILVAFQNPSR